MTRYLVPCIAGILLAVPLPGLNPLGQTASSTSIEPSSDSSAVMLSIGEDCEDDSDKFARAEGQVLLPLGSFHSIAHGYAEARRQAYLKAEAELAPKFGEYRVAAGDMRIDEIFTKSQVNLMLTGLVRSAIPCERYRIVNGSVEATVILRVPITGDGSPLLPFLQAIQDSVVRETAKYVKIPSRRGQGAARSQPPINVTAGSFRHLVIDCRHLDYKSAMFPNIIDNNDSLIYGLGVMSKAVRRTGGMTKKKRSLEEVSTLNWPGNPLVVKALRLERGSDIIVDQESAERIDVADANAGFIAAGHVVILWNGPSESPTKGRQK